jgi:glycosyltransferase involved in cell wall biosynthesis
VWKVKIRRAVVVTATHIHFRVVVPVVDELLRRGWQVSVLHFESFWERIEGFLLKRRRRSVVSFYTKTERKTEGKTSRYAVRFFSNVTSGLLKLFGISKPNILIVMSEGIIPTKVAVEVARRLGIPTLLLLQLGMLGKNYECPTFLADKISVPGDFIKDLVLGCGIDEKRIVVTGRPTYDALIRTEERFDKVEICRKLGLNPGKKILVYCTENLPLTETQKMAYAICGAMRNFRDVQFVIKVHPSELSVSLYTSVLAQAGIQALITRDADIYEVLYICDVMLTGYSTAALDAMILNKPVITLNLTGLKDPIPFAESGAAIGVYDEKDLKEAVKNVLYDDSIRERLRKDREKFVFEQTYLKDGKATERIVNLAEQMVANLN